MDDSVPKLPTDTLWYYLRQSFKQDKLVLFDDMKSLLILENLSNCWNKQLHLCCSVHKYSTYWLNMHFS